MILFLKLQLFRPISVRNEVHTINRCPWCILFFFYSSTQRSSKWSTFQLISYIWSPRKFVTQLKRICRTAAFNASVWNTKMLSCSDGRYTLHRGSVFVHEPKASVRICVHDISLEFIKQGLLQWAWAIVLGQNIWEHLEELLEAIWVWLATSLL